MRCDAELCPYWTGQGCICAVLDPLSDATDDDATRADLLRQGGEGGGT